MKVGGMPDSAASVVRQGQQKQVVEGSVEKVQTFVENVIRL